MVYKSNLLWRPFNTSVQNAKKRYIEIVACLGGEAISSDALLILRMMRGTATNPSGPNPEGAG